MGNRRIVILELVDTDHRQKREPIARLLKAEPTASDRRIAKAVKPDSKGCCSRRRRSEGREVFFRSRLLKTEPTTSDRQTLANAVKPDNNMLPRADAVSKDVRKFLTPQPHRSEHIING